jgi:hypothetical protein
MSISTPQPKFYKKRLAYSKKRLTFASDSRPILTQLSQPKKQFIEMNTEKQQISTYSPCHPKAGAPYSSLCHSNPTADFFYYPLHQPNPKSVLLLTLLNLLINNLLRPHTTASHQPHTADHKLFVAGDASAVAGHKSCVAGHKSSVAGHESPVAGHRQCVAGHKSRVAGHEQYVASHKRSVAGHGSSVAGHKRSVANHKLSVAGQVESVAGLRSYVAGRRLPVAGYRWLRAGRSVGLSGGSVGWNILLVRRSGWLMEMFHFLI